MRVIPYTMQVTFPTAIPKKRAEHSVTCSYKEKAFLCDCDEHQQFISSSRLHLISLLPQYSYLNLTLSLKSIMHLSNFVKTIAILSFSIAPVVTAIPIAIPFRPDPSVYYRLTNDYTGPNKALDVINDSTNLHKIHIVDLANFSGQFWRFHERSPGKYDLSTRWLGPDKCLDVINDAGVASTSVRLADKGDFSGQFWTLTPWGDGSWRLTNDFTGPNKHLDVYSDTKEGFLGTDNHSGQHWHLTKI